MPLKNVALTVQYMAWDTANNVGKTGDVSNHTLRLIQDGTANTPTNSAAEVDAVNCPGVYKLALESGEMNYSVITIAGKSSTSNVSIIPLVLTTEAGYIGTIKTQTDKMAFTVTNKIDANVYTWNGTAVASPNTAGYPVVTVKSGTGTGEINLSSGKVPATLAYTDVSGNVAADVQTVKGQAVTCGAGVTINPNVGTTQPVNFTGTAASALVKSDMIDIASAAVSDTAAQIGVNVVQVSGDATAADNLEAACDGTTYNIGGGAVIAASVTGSVDSVTDAVAIQTGTGAGQLDITSGVVKSNLVEILGTALTETGGLIAAAFKKFFNVVTPTGTVNSIPDAVAGATGGLAIVGSVMGKSPASLAAADVSGNLPSDLKAITTGVDFNTAMKDSLNAATPAVTVSDKSGFVLTTDYDAAKTAATQASVNAIPTTPLLAGNYTAPDNASIASIKTITDQIRFTVTNQIDANALTGGGGGGATAEDVWTYQTRGLTDKAGFTISGTKTTLDALNDIAAGAAMTLTQTYDAAKTAATQASVNAIPTTPLLAGNYVAPDNADIGTILTMLESATYGLNALLTAIGGQAVEGAITRDGVLRLLLSAVAGNSSGLGTGLFATKNQANSKNRLAGTYDSEGNRTMTVVDGT